MAQIQGNPIHRPMTVVELIGTLDEPDEVEGLYAAARNPAFAFLYEPQEDIYTLDDGQPLTEESGIP